MRLLASAAALAVAITGLVGFDTSAGGAVIATVKIVQRPVTLDGHAAPGVTVSHEPAGQVDCSYPEPSPGAVNRNINFCSPFAEYAVACWKSAAPAYALCMRNARIPHLVRIPRTGTFAHTLPPDRASRAPLVIVLRDGDRCAIRAGGAWASLPSHPNWVGTYSCREDGIVWASPTAAHYGVNESTSDWTVRTAQPSGGPVVTRHVARAYFVGHYFG